MLALGSGLIKGLSCDGIVLGKLGKRKSKMVQIDVIFRWYLTAGHIYVGSPSRKPAFLARNKLFSR